MKRTFFVFLVIATALGWTVAFATSALWPDRESAAVAFGAGTTFGMGFAYPLLLRLRRFFR